MLIPVMIAGFTLGAVSSLHCVGMCGPLALALPIHHLSNAKQLISLFLYQLGRVITYSLLGLLFGVAGRSIYLVGFQQVFSIVMGAIVLTLVVVYWLYNKPLQPSLFRRGFMKVQSFMMKNFRSKHNAASFLLLGIANGLLPCAMVYVAIAGAVTATHVSHSIVFMAMFGAGTLPAMMILGYFGRMVSLPVRNIFRRSVPFFMIIMAVVLILRGLNLGIPFISPVMPEAMQAAVSCH